MTRHDVLRRTVVAVALGAAAGCGDNLLPATGGTAPAPPAITGVNRVIHWDESGGSTVVDESPQDLYIEAELPGGAAMPDVRPAAVADDGSFAIAGAPPAGPYWLRVVDGPASREDVYVLTEQTELDLGRDVVGDGAAVATRADTQLVVTAGGLAAWADGDDGDLVLPGLAHFSSIAPFYATNTPNAGDTSLDVHYAWFSQALSAAPAAAYVVQTRTAHDDALALDFTYAVKAFHSAPIAIADGVTSTIAGAFVDPPPLVVPVRWMRTAFAAQAASMHPAGCQDDLQLESYWVHALPGHGAHGELAGMLYDGLDDLPEYGPRVVEAVSPLDETDLVGTLTVPNPYPTDWLYAKYSMSFGVRCAAPDGHAPGNARVSIGVLTSDLGDAPVTPLVGPVRQPQIAGRDLLTPQRGVGLAPTVSWQPPSLGTATSYQLRLFEVVRFGLGGNGLALHEDARFIVPGTITTITLPRDVLVDGTLYTIEIRAISQAGQDVARAPFRSGIPLGFADLLTNYFQP